MRAETRELANSAKAGEEKNIGQGKRQANWQKTGYVISLSSNRLVILTLR